MIIDFHTHIFPDKIAGPTIELLAAKGGITPFADGTEAGLISAMEMGGVDISIALPVLTNPLSFERVNRFAIEVNERYSDKARRIISFGAIHPLCEDIGGKMKYLKTCGFKGVKIHPDYQGAYINDEGYVKILKAACEYDLTVITHAGVDVAYPDDVHCPPSLAKELFMKAPHKKFVMAHLGNVDLCKEFFELFSDTPVYVDTAYVLRYFDTERFKKWTSALGDERILFGTDSPWSDVAADVKTLKSFNLPEKTLEKIFSGNAKKLLEI